MRSIRRLTDSSGEDLPSLRFTIREAARILRMSRAQLYNRINEGSILVQKDGARTYITRSELERYIFSCDSNARQTRPLNPAHGRVHELPPPPLRR
jgi:excisionase family DNA binding protein